MLTGRMHLATMVGEDRLHETAREQHPMQFSVLDHAGMVGAHDKVVHDAGVIM